MKGLPKIALILSIITAVISGITSVFKYDVLNLAGTQWMIIAILFGVWAMAFKDCDWIKK